VSSSLDANSVKHEALSISEIKLNKEIFKIINSDHTLIKAFSHSTVKTTKKNEPNKEMIYTTHKDKILHVKVQTEGHMDGSL